MRKIGVPVIVALGIAVLLLSGLSVAEESRRFTGSWKINLDQSDRPEPPGMRDGSRPGSTGGQGGRGMGGPGGNGSRGARGSGAPQGGRRGPVGGAQMDAFYLEQREDSIRILLSEDRSREIFTDGRSFKTYGFGGDEIEMSARWEGNKLVVNETSSRGMSSTETWELSESDHQLIITRTMKRPDGSEGRATRRVYDAVE